MSTLFIIITTISITTIIDWGLGYLIDKSNSKKEELIENEYYEKITQIMEDKNIPLHEKFEDVKHHSRMTEGKLPAATYFFIDILENMDLKLVEDEN
jgi:hypothetical protein